MFQKPPSDAGLEKAIERVLHCMTEVEPDSDEYATLVEQLVKLHTLKTNTAKTGVSKDTLITVGANLVGVLLLLNYERTHIVTSKALSLVTKLK